MGTSSGVKDLTKVTCVQNVDGLLGEQRLLDLGGGSIMVREFVSGLVAWYPDEDGWGFSRCLVSGGF